MVRSSCDVFREIDMTLPQVLEALIFAAPKPLPTADLLAAVQAAGESSEVEAAQAHARASEADIVAALEALQNELEQGGRSFRLMEQATGWGFVTRGEFAPWVRKLYPDAKPARLSGPAMETLAIIAYRQPVTRADIEAVRGVAVDGVMQVLLDRSLVRIAGRADLPGRPLLYSTTGYFLEHFGLKSTQDLPNAAELGRMNLPKAAVSGEKAAKQREKEEQEPELPLGMATEQDVVSAPEAGLAEAQEPVADPAHAGLPPEDSPAVVFEAPPAWGTEASMEDESTGGRGLAEPSSLSSESAGDAPPEDDFSS